MKSNNTLKAVLVVVLSIVMAVAVETFVEKATANELPCTDAECEKYYGITLEESVDSIGYKSGMTEGWGVEGNGEYYNDWKR